MCNPDMLVNKIWDTKHIQNKSILYNNWSTLLKLGVITEKDAKVWFKRNGVGHAFDMLKIFSNYQQYDQRFQSNDTRL